MALAGVLALFCGGCAIAETGAPLNVAADRATVGGHLVTTTGGPVQYWAQYGLTTAYGAETAHETLTAAPNAAELIELEIGGLARSTTYHYRLCARDSQPGAGPGCGAGRTLTTQAFVCGEAVTTSVRLTGNLTCIRGDAPALVVGAAGIDINLAGYALVIPVLAGGAEPPAVDNFSGFADVTIRNGRLVGGRAAIRLLEATGNVVRGVEASAGADAIAIFGGRANEVRLSTAFGRTSGINASGSADVILASNRVDGTFGDGIVVAGDGARIVRNEVSSSSAGGITILSGVHGVVAENQVTDAPAGDGISVAAPTADTLVRNNVAARNGGDGIEIRSSDARVRENLAFDNGGFGIDAAIGVTDLGGNTAFGNGNPLQCRNVFCS